MSLLLKFVLLAIASVLLVAGATLVVFGITGLIHRNSGISKKQEAGAEDHDHRRAA
jgi:hypothetical protein